LWHTVHKAQLPSLKENLVSPRTNHDLWQLAGLVVPRNRTTGFGPRSVETTSLTLRQFPGRPKTEMFLRSYAVTMRHNSYCKAA